MMILLSLFIPLLIGWASDEQPECRQLLDKAVAKFKLQQATPAKGLLMDYHVTSTSREGDVIEDEISIRAYGSKVLTKSNDITMYQDAETVVVVQAGSKTVFISGAVTVEARKSQLANWAVQQDSLLKSLELKECEAEVLNERTCSKMTFGLSKRLSAVGVDKVIYWIEPEELEVRRIYMTYADNENSRLKTWEMKVDEMSTQYRNAPFTGTALSVVWDGKNLKPVYKGYKIVDQR